jgi:potassium/hydrogen antiporter
MRVRRRAREETAAGMISIDFVNTVIVAGAALIVIGIFSSLVATRFGAPLLLVFLVLGMLAGQDGPGGIVFNDYQATYLFGMIALSVILFDGGLRTRLSAFRGVLAPSVTLATLGVLISAAITGFAAWALLGLNPTQALLLGAIVGSTDAAAVFFLLRTGGLRLPGRVGSTLEIESGTNDPIAVFLVIVLTEYLVAGARLPDIELLLRFAQQGAIGAAFGLAGGFAAVAILNRVEMPGGLHPLFVISGAVLISGLTAIAGGSGLLAAYLAGLVMANRPTRAYPSIVGFHDAATWLFQIVMFIMLGLLVTPSTLIDYAFPGIAIALVLTFVARPVMVWLCLTPFGYAPREKAFISWVGLRGAVSIFLAAIPTLAGLPEGDVLFNVAFFVVLVSLLVQGSTLRLLARRLGLALRQTTPKTSRVEIDIPGQTEQEIVGYPVTPDSVILGLSKLPSWARIIMVVRRREILEPAAAVALQPADYVYFLVPRDRLPRLDSLFRTSPDVARRLGLLFGELPIRGDAFMAEVARYYDLDVGRVPEDITVAEWAAAQLGDRLGVDAAVAVPSARLVVRRMEGGRVASLGLQLREILQVDPDDGLIDRLVDDAAPAQGAARRLRRWWARRRGRGGGLASARERP